MQNIQGSTDTCKTEWCKKILSSEEKCKGFQSIDGIAYTSSLAYLVACPSDRTKEVVVPDGVRVISSSSFKNCSIVSVKFPDSVVNIEDKAFYNCKSLKHVDFGHGITHIGSASSWNVFASCGLEEADIPEQVTYIGSGAFWACELKKVTFHEGLLKIAWKSLVKRHTYRWTGRQRLPNGWKTTGMRLKLHNIR